MNMTYNMFYKSKYICMYVKYINIFIVLQRAKRVYDPSEDGVLLDQGVESPMTPAPSSVGCCRPTAPNAKRRTSDMQGLDNYILYRNYNNNMHSSMGCLSRQKLLSYVNLF